MNYQDVTPEYFIFTATDGTALTGGFTANNGFINIQNGNPSAGAIVKVPFSGIQSTNGGIIQSVAGTAGVWTINTGAPVANTTYSVNLLQIIDGVVIERQISYTTPSVVVGNEAAVGLNAIINKLLAVGTFEIATSTSALNQITVTSVLTNATLKISAGQNVTVSNTVAPATPAIPPRGRGVDLVNIVDVNGISPVAGNTYDTLTLDYQVDRIGLEGASRFERKQLVILFQDGIANLLNLEAVVGDVLSAEAPAAGAPIEQIALQ